MIKNMLQNMHMDRQRANDRIESLLTVHIQALDGDPNARRVVEALKNAKSDFHGLITEIYDELDAILAQEEANREAGFTE